jgi:hypothetical protein
MRCLPFIPAFLLPLLASTAGWAQSPAPEPKDAPTASCEPPATCVPDPDMQMFVKLLKEKRCQLDEPPTFALDPINIVVDKQGRVFYSGAEPRPYTLKMSWCPYAVEAQGKVDIVAAMQEPEIWGFHFRPKAYIGAIPLEAAYKLPEDESLRVTDLVDAGVMVDFLYYDWVNLNAAAGFRTFGGGVGIDLLENFGAYAGWAMTWMTWHQNVNVGLWFSFWNPE